MGVDVEGKGGGDGCSWFLKSSPLPGPPATPKGVREASTGDTTDPPTALSGAGKSRNPPPRASPSPSKSRPSSPISGFGDEEDDGGGGIVLTLGSSEPDAAGHIIPPRAAARLTRVCVRRCSSVGTENALCMRLVWTVGEVDI